MHEHGQLYVYEHRCVCCTNKFSTIDKNQMTCSPKCFLLFDDFDQYVDRYFSDAIEKPDFCELFFG